MKRTAGFTLIELLVVTMIIGILMSIMITAGIQVLKYARELSIYTELMQMDVAIKNYESTYGAFPPNLMEQESIDRHLATILEDRTE